MHRSLAILIVLTAAGCASHKPVKWANWDGSSILAGGPTAIAKADRAQMICWGRGNAAMASGYAPNLGAAMARQQAAVNVIEGCMAEQGYRRVQ